MKPLHILTSDPAAEALCESLRAVGQEASWGDATAPAAKYLVELRGAATVFDVLAAIRSAHTADVDSLRAGPVLVRVRRRREAVPDTVAPPAETTAPETGRPVVLHVMPWDLTVGGAQRMLDLWCSAECWRWDIHIATGSRLAPDWPFRGATLHQGVSSPQALADLCDSLQPAVVVQHWCGAAIAPGAAAWPQVWVIHGDRVTAAPKPDHAEPRACLVNHPPEDGDASWDGTRFEVLRLAVDTDRYRPATEPHRRDWLVAGIVGRLSEEKVPWSFVEALASWQPGLWRVRFVGRGAPNGYAPRVQARLAGLPWVEFAGDVPPEAMPASYRDLDALLVPSATESGSYAIAEAMACGLPVVARRVGGIPYTTGGYATLCDTDDDLLACLGRLDAESCAEAGIVTRWWAETAFALARHIAAHTAAYAAAALPRVSILVPVWNTRPEYLRECWDSILAQTMPLWELVLVDDGSDSIETVEALEAIAAADPRVRLLRFAHRGIAASLNDGLAACRSNIVARMDSDDTMTPDRLAVQLARWDRQPHSTAALGGQLDWIGRPERGQTHHPAVITRRIVATSDWLLNHPATLLNRAAVQSVGGYDPACECAQDLDLWLRLHAAGWRLVNHSEVVLHYRNHPGQHSAGLNHDTVTAIRSRLASQRAKE